MSLSKAGLRGHFLWGMLPEIWVGMLGLYHSTAPQYGDVVIFDLHGVPVASEPIS